MSGLAAVWAWLQYALLRAAVCLVGVLPERLAYTVAAVLGRTYFRLSRRRQQLALRFLRHAFGDAPGERELLDLGRRATGNAFKVAIDFVRLPRLARRGRLAERFDLSQARFPEPPYLAVTGHLGCWEAGGATTSLLGQRLYVVAKTLRNPWLDAYVLAQRRATGFVALPRRGGIRDLVRVLEAGGVAAMVVDQNQRLRPVVAPFFGALCRNERSTATLALRWGYPVVVGACLRVGHGARFRTVMLEPMRFEPTDDHEADLVRVTTEINHRLEELIRLHPEQYLWIHDRYRGVERCLPAR